MPDLNLKKEVDKPQRDYLGEALFEQGKADPRVLVLTADLEPSLKFGAFREEFPDRFLNLGVAEQNLIGTAVGLSLGGFIPFCGSFAVFLPGRCFDQIRVSVCQNKANVKLIGGHLGFSNAGDGASAQSFEDLALARSLPEMVVFCPFDGQATKGLVKLAASHPGPVYLRISKTEVPEKLTDPNFKFEVGGSRVLQEGQNLTIISQGPILKEVLSAVGQIKRKDNKPEVIDVYCLKPLDKKRILKSAAKTGKVLVVEESSIYGGLGSAVAELLGQEYPLPIKILGVPDVFGESARSWQELLKKYKMDSNSILKTIKELVFH